MSEDPKMSSASDARVTPVSLALAAVRALRPKQWVKQAFMLPAIVFSGKFLDGTALLQITLGLVAFSLFSSTGYILNDVLDRENDRKHPKKKHRPIASGALPVPAALILMLAVFCAAISLSAYLSWVFLAVALTYLATTLSYSFYFKHQVILDVMFLASGFVWRVIAGAVAIEVRVSLWLFLCAAFVALWIGFNKRRSELLALGPSGVTRKNLALYNPRMLTEFQSIVTANTVLCYALYSVLGPNPWMVVTLPFVLYGMFRFIYLIEVKGEGGAPDEMVLKDWPMVVTVLSYIGVAAMLTWLDMQGTLPNILPE